MDRNPGIDAARIGRPRDLAARGERRRARLAQMKSDDERAARLEQIATRERQFL